MVCVHHNPIECINPPHFLRCHMTIATSSYGQPLLKEYMCQRDDQQTITAQWQLSPFETDCEMKYAGRCLHNRTTTINRQPHSQAGHTCSWKSPARYGFDMYISRGHDLMTTELAQSFDILAC